MNKKNRSADTRNLPRPRAVEPPATQDLMATSTASRLVEVLDRYLEDLQQGTAPSREAILAAHPELAEHLDACLAGIDFIQGAATAEDSGSSPKRLGDFRILREVGRGGMGAVYEAEQISLGRRVALKVLRFGAVSDPAAIDRFRREAETVANLHHTNIVPIFSVGSDQGINFYAMQFIEGRSLDAVLRQSESPLPVKTVARWGLEAAEALAHAHERQVIHRDVKPSNLMLDEEGRIWLTDFGLAKRIDDITLSMTGALLGTPRYMSPEQAAATQEVVDHRSDIYSLGASLYELVTQRPVFEADSHLAVIGKILEEEPISPRSIRATIPRDFETILLRCLSKDMARRYETAEDLAEDLRSFVKDRSIKARRPSVLERSARWLRKNKRSFTKTLSTVAATAVALLFVVWGIRAYTQSHLAFVELDSETSLVARVTDRNEAEKTVTLPTQAPIEVAAGEVRVHVEGEKTLGHEYLLTMEPGQQTRFEPQPDELSDQRRIAVRKAYGLFPTEQGTDVILMDHSGLQRCDAAGGQIEWTLPLDSRDSKHDISWPWRGAQPFLVGQLDKTQLTEFSSVRSLPRAIDIDRDGHRDIIVAARHEAWLMGISGKTGEVAWFRKLAAPQGELSAGVLSSVTSPPLVVDDVDEDGVADLLASCIQTTNTKELIADQPRRWLELISGADGRKLWEFELLPAWFEIPPGGMVPYRFRWFPQGTPSTTIGASGSSTRRGGVLFREKKREYRSHGFHVQVPDAPQLVGGNLPATSDDPDNLHGDVIALTAGTHIVSIDRRTGELLLDIDIERQTLQPTAWSDLDGDGLLDAVILDEAAPEKIRCSAWSLASKTRMWQVELAAAPPAFGDNRDIGQHWPQTVDLDGDGAAEVIVPGDSSTRKHHPRLPWGELQVLRGRDGKPLWRHRLMGMDQQVNHFAVGPDLDRDGLRELFAVTLWGEEFELYVEALSGADGHAIWWTRQTLPVAPRSSIDYVLGPIRWASAGTDGWPRLLVQAHPDNGVGESQVCLLSAGSGDLRQTVRGAQAVTPTDVDGDALTDLVSFLRCDPVSDPGQFGELEVYRHVLQRWRRLASRDWLSMPDVNGDDVRDLLGNGPGAIAHAYCGDTGKLLWKSQGENFNSLRFPPPSGGGIRDEADLDGDLVPDLLAWQRTGASSRAVTPFRAVSGKTGKRIWTADIEVQVIRGVPLFRTHDLDGDDQPEVLVVAAMDWGYERRMTVGTGDQQLWLVILNGQNGRVRWKQPLSKRFGPSTSNGNVPFEFAKALISPTLMDCNQDDVLDIVLPAVCDGGESILELRAYDGRRGELLWQHAMPPASSQAPLERLSRHTPVDLDDDGLDELLVMAFEETSGERGQTLRQHHLVALNGDGSERWRWKSQTPRIFHWSPENALDERGPVVLHRAGKPHGICFPFTSDGEQGKGELTVLDLQGKPRLTRRLESRMGYRVWAAATELDRDHVVLTNVEELLGIDLEKPHTNLWSRTLGGSHPLNSTRVIGVQHQEIPVLLLKHAAGDNSLEGIDAVTGRRAWNCVGPTPRNRFGWVRIDHVELLNPTAELPSVFFQSGDVAQCRQAAVSRPEEPGRRFASDGVNGEQTAKIVSRVLGPDPRLTRQLPWIRFMRELAEAAAQYWLWGIFYAVTMVVLPLTALLWLLVRRRWGMRTIVLLPAVAAVFLIGYGTAGPAPIVFSTMQKLIVGVSFLPVLTLGIALVYWVTTQQWRPMRLWGGATLIVSLTLAATLLLLARSGGGEWFPGERYSLEGWHWILVAGIYVTGWALMLSVPRMLRTWFSSHHEAVAA